MKRQAGGRLLFSPDLYNKASGLCLVCPITTQLKGYPFEVPVEGTRKTSGVVLADQIRSIDWEARKVRIVDHIPSAFLAPILAKFKPLLF